MTPDTLLQLFPEAQNIPQEWNIDEGLHQRHYLVGGKMKTWTGNVQKVLSPICVRNADGSLTQKTIGSFPLTDLPEAMEALDAAEKAYNNGRGEWPTMTMEERIACVAKFTAHIIQKRAEVVKLLMWEIGKSQADAEKEFDRTIEYIYNTIDAVKDLDRQSSRFTIEQGIIGQIRRSPLGIVLCMGPFNYPLNETYTLLIPALIMGNVILFKPPKYGALLHHPLQDAFMECFPAGVMNMVYGRGHIVVSPLMQTGKINVLTLIGSSKVANDLKKQHPKVNRLRAILGLDAKNAAIVLENADLELAVKECMLGALSFNGQRCTAIKIIFVQKSIADAFLKRMAEEMSKLKVGMPWEKGVQITPLPEVDKPNYIANCIKEALENGATVVNTDGGLTMNTLVYPALIYPVNEKMKLYREEQFGPIIPAVPFEEVEEAIQYLITSDHGQQVSIFGTNADQIAHLIDHLVNQVSRVNINSQCQRGPDTFPFTGRKDSAEGTLSVNDALRSFSIRTVVTTKESDANKAIFNEIVNNHESKFLSTKFIF